MSIPLWKAGTQRSILHPACILGCREQHKRKVLLLFPKLEVGTREAISLAYSQMWLGEPPRSQPWSSGTRDTLNGQPGNWTCGADPHTLTGLYMAYAIKTSNKPRCLQERGGGSVSFPAEALGAALSPRPCRPHPGPSPPLYRVSRAMI